MRKSKSFIAFMLKHADGIDLFLMSLGFIGAVGDGISTPVLLFVTSMLMNNIGRGPTSSDPTVFLHNINKVAAILLYASCGFFVACFLEGYCWTRTGERQATRIRSKYLKAVLRQDIGYFDTQETSTTEVITSVSNDTLVIQDTISEKVPNFLMNVATFAGGNIFALAMLWKLALIAFPFVLLLIIPGFMYGRILMDLSRKNIKEYNTAGIIAEQAIASIRTVYSFVGETKTLKEFSEALEETVKLGIKQGLAKGLAIGSNGLVFGIWAFMFWYGSKMVMYHGARGGTVYAVGSLVAGAGQALGSALSNMKSFTEACSAGEHIMQIINRVPTIDSNSAAGEILQQISGTVEFKGIKFAYPSRPSNIIFENICLTIPAGKTMALVGASGSGKSTVISLLQRFYDPIGGEILLDGVAIDKLQLQWLRSQMGLVNQEPSLFATSIRENILFGKEDATMEEIIEAAKVANAHNFISQLPQGYNTQVGERGVQMSGGQKQRIAIARAVIRAPSILLLDEATSALDSESERIVQKALDKAAVGRTTVIVAHRLSTIRGVSSIAVIQDGQVMETGSPEDLSLNQNGIYTKLLRAKIKEQSVLPTIPCWKMNVALNSPTESISRESESVESKLGHIVPNPSFWRLLVLNLPEWRQASMGCLSAALAGAVQPLIGYAMGTMVSVYFLPNHNQIKSETKKYAFFFLGLAAFSMVINVVQHYNFAVMGEYLTKRIRESMLSKILAFEVEWFDQDENSTGAVCSRLGKDANLVRSLVGDRMALLVQTMSAVILSCTMGLIIALKLAIVMIAAQPLVVASLYARRVLLKKMSKKSVRAQEESCKLSAEAVANIRTVTSFSSQARILEMFSEAQEGPIKESKTQSLFSGVGLATCRGVLSCSWTLSFWYGGQLVSNGSISAKALFETFLVLVSTGRVIAEVATMTTDLARGAEAVSSVFAILHQPNRIKPNDPQGIKPIRLRGQVDFCDVHFVYPTRPNVTIFNGLALSIDEGKSTALVGPSGSGKSTIIGLIERFYEPLNGSIMIDGVDLRLYHLRCLRQHIGLVNQEPTLFSGTIKENIAYGAPDEVNESEIYKASTAANAHDFITQLKDGYNTRCGDRGLQLSGGQKQRIAIARAMLKNPALLLLDEATSALDGQAERVVQDALERVMVGRTSVVVAHRLSTIQNCDLILVLDKGLVVEKGTHKSLMERGSEGAYYSLVSLQQGPSPSNV